MIASDILELILWAEHEKLLLLYVVARDKVTTNSRMTAYSLLQPGYDGDLLRTFSIIRILFGVQLLRCMV